MKIFEKKSKRGFESAVKRFLGFDAEGILYPFLGRFEYF